MYNCGSKTTFCYRHAGSKMKKKYPCIESMTTIKVDFLKIRVWREQTEIQDYYDNTDIQAFVNEIVQREFPYPVGQCDIEEISTKLAELPNVNAVEVKDKCGNGVVIYTNWP